MVTFFGRGENHVPIMTYLQVGLYLICGTEQLFNRLQHCKRKPSYI